MATEEDEPDWESFETYKGHDEPPRIPRWLALVFHYFMIALCLVIAFAVSGFVFFFYTFSRRHALDETMHDCWMRFILGGVIGVVLLFYWRYRKTR